MWCPRYRIKSLFHMYEKNSLQHVIDLLYGKRRTPETEDMEKPLKSPGGESLNLATARPTYGSLTGDVWQLCAALSV